MRQSSYDLPSSDKSRFKVWKNEGLGSDEHIFRRRQIRLRLLGRGLSQHLSERQRGSGILSILTIFSQVSKTRPQDALHISVEARRGNETYEWSTCSDVIFEKYKVKYKNTKELFNYVLQNTRVRDLHHFNPRT